MQEQCLKPPAPGDDIAYVEHHTHPSDKVTIIERWVPAEIGEYAPFLFRPAGKDKYIAMKLDSRTIIDPEALQHGC